MAADGCGWKNVVSSNVIDRVVQNSAVSCVKFPLGSRIRLATDPWLVLFRGRGERRSKPSSPSGTVWFTDRVVFGAGGPSREPAY
jgi:hypothetical protein